MYADDTHIYGCCSPSAVYMIYTAAYAACIDDVHSWMQSNRLQLNSTKSELLWYATKAVTRMCFRGCFMVEEATPEGPRHGWSSWGVGSEPVPRQLGV